MRLENNELISTKIDALDKVDISIRLWIDKDSTLPSGSLMHYHGLLEIKDDTGTLAMLK